MTFDPNRIVKLIRSTVADDLEKAGARFGIGIVDQVEGGYASVRKGDPEAAATPGFIVSPDLNVLSGDNVWYYDMDRFRLVVKVLSRNAVIPDELTVKDLTLTGRLVRASSLDITLTATVDNFDPIGGTDAYVWRINQTGGAWTINGIRADPGVEHLLLNVSTGNATLGYNASTGVGSDILTPNNAALVIRPNGGVRVWHDPTSAAWRAVSP